MIAALLILGAIVIGAVFGAGALTAIASSLFNFLKGIFGVGFGCTKSCISVVMLLLVTLLFALLMSRCS